MAWEYSSLHCSAQVFGVDVAKAVGPGAGAPGVGAADAVGVGDPDGLAAGDDVGFGRCTGAALASLPVKTNRTDARDRILTECNILAGDIVLFPHLFDMYF